MDEMPNTVRLMCIVMASIAPSAAPLDTPSVSGVASGFRSSAWNPTPGAARRAHTRLQPNPAARQRCADQRTGQDPRQARDEENLRVGVVREGDGAIEHAAE